MDAELKEMIEGFVEDCRAGFESMEEDLMTMEEDPENTVAINNLFRVMHTLKGTAGFMGLDDIQNFSHILESLFDLLREKQLGLSPNLIDFILPCIDKLKAMVFGQIDEQKIPDIQKELAILEEIVSSGSDAILSKDAKDSEEPLEPLPDLEKTATSPPNGQETKTEPSPTLPLDSIDIEVPPPPNPPEPGVASELLQQFVIEAEEHLELIEESLLALDENPENEEAISGFFRAIHSIKGTAGYVNLQQIETLSHRIETIFDAIRKGQIVYNKNIGDVIFKSVDLLRTMVFYIKNEDYVHTLDISHQLKRLVAIPLTKQETLASNPTEIPKEATSLEGIELDKLNTFLTSAEQHLEILLIYQEKMQKDALTEHDLITMHRALKTLQSGAKYCQLVRLAMLINECEECLLRVLEGEFEQIETVVKETLQPAQTKVIEELEHLQKEYAAHKQSQNELAQQEQEQATAQATPPPESVPPKTEAPSAKPTTKPTAKPTAKPIADSQPEDIPETSISKPVDSQTKSPKNPPPKQPPLEKTEAPQQAQEPSTPLPVESERIMSDAEKAQQRAARKSSKPVETKAIETVSENKTMRVDASRLDRFMNLIGELIIARNAFRHLADTINDQKSLSNTIQDIKLIENNIRRISDNLQVSLMEMRLVQVKTIFQRMPRIVRDLSRKTEKKIALKMVGETTEVDKSIVEEIGDPLVHIIRNSCDHGLESPEIRLAVGKPEEGTITLKAGHMGSFIEIDIIDDGRGIDPMRIKKIAIQKGVITKEEAETMTDHQAINLIFAPSFTTAEEISDISGRGVGMDVVMNNIRKIQGTVDVNSKLGEGTQVRLRLPLTLAVIDALIIGVKGTSYAIPLDAVKETVQIQKRTLKTLKNKWALDLRGDILGVTPLAELLYLNSSQEEDSLAHQDDSSNISIVVLHVNGHEIGVSVDRLFNQQEVVVKPLEEYLAAIPGLKGSTIMGDGKVVLILEPNELVELAATI